MNPIAELRDAALGWVDLIGRAKDDIAARFNATPAGLVAMLIWYTFFVILTLVIQSLAGFGALPGLEQLIVTLALNGLPMLVILLVVWGTHATLKPPVDRYALLVPAGYALVLLLIVGLAFSLLGFTLATALQGMLGYMLYRLAREIADLGMGISIAFALLTVVLLVALPIGLYMLLMPELPAPNP